jgi:hypothetical protein
MMGGFGHGRDADAEDQVILHTVKSEIESHLGNPVKELRALKVTTQVVAGTNYLMKVKADDKIIHVKIHKPLPHRQENPHLMAIQKDNHTEDTPLEYFE